MKSPNNSTLADALRLHQAGDLSQAKQAYQAILKREPNNADAVQLLGVIALQTRDFSRAIELIEKAIRLAPNAAPFYNNLGEALRHNRERDRAVAAYHRAIELNPSFADPHANLGFVYATEANADAAIDHLAKAAKLGQNRASVFQLLGSLLMSKGRPHEAAEVLTRAVQLQPNHFESQLGLGALLMDFGCFTDALRHYEKAAELRPDFGGTYNNIGNLLSNQGDVEKSIESYRRALALEPTNAALHSNLIFALNHHPTTTEQDLAVEHKLWNERHAPKRDTLDYSNDRNPDRILRIGYISGDFGANQGAYFIEPILATHHRDRVWVKCYSTLPIPDPVTMRMKTLADDWQDIAPLSEGQLEAQIRSDAIDILVDLSSHTRFNRLTVFVRRPAPVQITYLGYPGTCGLPAMQYRFTDIHLDPPGQSRPHDVERLIRLPQTYFCYQPPKDAPPPAVRKSQKGGFTFGSFNKLNKLNEPTVRLWSKVLTATPDSRLLLKAHGLRDANVAQLIRNRFAKYDIKPDRIELLGFGPFAEHLKDHERLDVALDPLIFNGGTTSLHAMWMGVPIITLAGNTPRSRMGLSLLSSVGLNHLVAESEDRFLEICSSLARDVDQCTQIRQSLRLRMQNSPLTDHQHFIARVEDAYRTAWRTWCEGREPVDADL